MKEWLQSSWYGLPKWAWSVMVVLAIVNEIILRAKWTRALSIFQAPFVAVLRMPVLGDVLGRLPIVGGVLRWLAGIDPPKPAIELPPTIRSGEGGFVIVQVIVQVLVTAVLFMMFMVGLSLLAGCAAGADGARQAVAQADSTIGQGYRSERTYIRACTKDAIAKASMAAQGACKQTSGVMLGVLDTASDTTDAVEASIGVAEAAKKKDYSAIVAPLIDAVGSVVKTFGDLGIKLGVK